MHCSKSDKEIYLQINIDVPLFKSSAKMFWQILCRVYFDPMIFHPVAIYTGNFKSKNLIRLLTSVRFRNK